MKQWPRRFRDTILEDRTRPVQVLCVLAAYLVAWQLYHFHTPSDPDTARAVFYFLNDDTFALILAFAGTLQLAAVGGPGWKLRWFAASVKLTVWVYAAVCYALTNPDALAVSFLVVMVVAELWVQSRSFYDKDVNGADLRVDN